MPRRSYVRLLVLLAPLLVASTAAAQPPQDFLRIRVVDAQTSRGIPLARLTTFNSIAYYTDSAGLVAFCEPGLMQREVWFGVESPGYSYPSDWLGSTGITLRTDPGSSATVVMTRQQPAQRLYRVTGAGIYRDSYLLGDNPPIIEGLISASVLGLDGSMCAVYHGKLFWMWGDTAHPRHPLACNFGGTGATSDLPGSGGLDPDVGINLAYFARGDFVKPMFGFIETGNAYWMGAMTSVKDAKGAEHLIGRCSRIQPPFKFIARYLVEFDDAKQEFRSLMEDKVGPMMQPNGHPFRFNDNGTTYVIMPMSSQLMRVPDSYEDVITPTKYEFWTCLKEGEQYKGAQSLLDRDADGKLRWSWKPNTEPIGQTQLEEMEEKGIVKPAECWIRLRDANSTETVTYHNGSIAWNAYRNKWIMILAQGNGKESTLGETWYAEAPSPTGPWVETHKVATHPKYSFYNPVHHPMFDKDGGRVIYFEGTYSNPSTEKGPSVPRYDYNEIMYKLELDDPRLGLKK